MNAALLRTALGAALLAAVAMGSDGRGQSRAEARCPPGYAADPARAGAILDALAGVPAGRRAVAGREALLCFGRGPSVVVNGGPLLLDRERADGTLAARTAHLLAHAADRAIFEGMPADPSACAAWVRGVADAERRAREVELDVAAALGAPPEEAPDQTAGYAARCAARQ